jgi:hypothetical protein
MAHPPPPSAAPLLPAVLRTLLFTAVIEAIFHRVLTIPARSEAWPWLARAHVTTGRAGQLMAFVSLALVLAASLGVAYAALRAPAWPGALNPLVALGLVGLVGMVVLASLGSPGPAFAAGFAILALAVGWGMLAGMYDGREDLPGRAFAVALAGAMTCGTAGTLSDLWADMTGSAAARALAEPWESAGRWLLCGAGALAFPAFSGPLRPFARFTDRAAAYGVSAASAFTLAVGVAAHPPILDRLAGAAGPPQASAVGRVAAAGAACAALFLATFTACRGLAEERGRARGFGILFLVLAGYPHASAYQHLLALTGLALLTAGVAPPPRPAVPRAYGPPEPPPAPAAGAPRGEAPPAEEAAPAPPDAARTDG